MSKPKTNSDQLVIDPEFASLLIPLTTDEHQWLEESLKREGCRDPLVAWRNNGKRILMDGHNRHEFCTELDISFGVVEVELESREAAKIWIRKNQIARRNLPDEARAMLAAELFEDMKKVALSERGRAAGRASGKARAGERVDDSSPHVRAARKDNLAELSKAAKLSRNRVKLAVRIKQKAIAIMGAAAAQKVCDEIKQGGLSLARAKRDLHKAEEKKKLEAAKAIVRPAIELCDLRVCSMEKLLAEARNLDAIITDPPYGQQFVPLYGELARLASQALRPNGVLAVMCGQAHLPEVLAQMCPHMPYRWTMAYHTPGSSARIWCNRMYVNWKPVLWFGGGQRRWISDVVESDAAAKQHHDWQQSETGMDQLVDALTEPSQLVCDPFLGSGTTAVSCIRLHRRVIGCDVDAAQVEKARARAALALAAIPEPSSHPAAEASPVRTQ
jgi:16S rRNA G966 N2-methylase RsmD